MARPRESRWSAPRRHSKIPKRRKAKCPCSKTYYPYGDPTMCGECKATRRHPAHVGSQGTFEEEVTR